MAQDQGFIGLAPGLAKVYVGMTDARSGDAHQDFIVPRTFHLEGFNLQGAAPLAQDGSLDL
jgi:hypothetical protein